MHFFKNIIIFIYFYGSGSEYPRIIEYRDEYPKSGYPETTNPDPYIKFTDPNPGTPNFLNIWIRPMPSLEDTIQTVMKNINISPKMANFLYLIY